PYGRYRFLRMLFGISTAPEVLQRAMRRALDGLPGVSVVMDDILVRDQTKEEHDENLKNVLERCQDHNLKLNRKKCQFLLEQVRYMGHVITNEGLSLDPGRLQDMLGIPEPKDTSRRLANITQETDKNPAMAQLRQFASDSWPEEKSSVPQEVGCYWDYRDELHVQDGLVFRSNKLIIPAGKRHEVLSHLHAVHGGAEEIKARARSVMYWPGINSDIEQLAKTFSTYQKLKPRNAKLPILNHDIPRLPWQVVTDLFHHNGQDF
ncbi:uncharacterized protein K02A2.6-like, partial [Ixodes scapularis]|uniref:uncharacterized protein K02A2.6-like n=1 Tax=Ixodes scapularis TaxID=6945 RepID=UPI001AD6F1C1